jgi:enolase
MKQAIIDAGYKPGTKKGDVAFAMDTACSELYDADKDTYNFEKAIKAKILSKNDGIITSKQMITYLESLANKFPIVSIEDGLSENDRIG